MSTTFTEEQKQRIAKKVKEHWAKTKDSDYYKERCKKISQGNLGKKSWNKGKKGLYPAWNKGLKGIHLSTNSEFKKGQKAWNKGIINRHGEYVNLSVNGKRIYEHDYIYCLSHDLDKIPEGYVIHHINGNKSDNRLENLMMLSRAEHMRLHQNLRSIWA